MEKKNLHFPFEKGGLSRLTYALQMELYVPNHCIFEYSVSNYRFIRRHV
jgi:hypothetical protein